jgi:hypothetical protein
MNELFLNPRLLRAFKSLKEAVLTIISKIALESEICCGAELNKLQTRSFPPKIGLRNVNCIVLEEVCGTR